MMGKMRNLAKWVLYILVFAFIALMVFEWGMDYQPSSGFQGDTTVGVIDGQEITYEQFSRAYNNALNAERQRSDVELDDSRREAIQNQVWESMVQEILLAKEVDRLGITVSEDDIYYSIVNNPDPQTQQNPNFHTNGQFDINLYKRALQDPNNTYIVAQMEAYQRQQMPLIKLSQLLNEAVIVTEQELRDEYRERNMKAKIEYLKIPGSAFSGVETEVTEDEIKSYYDKHKLEEFKVGETRKVNYVFFSLEPTAADSAEIEATAEYILQQARSGENFVSLVKGHSDDPGVNTSNGDQGSLSRDDISRRYSPEMAEAVFNAAEGDFLGPFKTRVDVQVLAVHERTTEEGVDKVHFSRIRLDYKASPTTEDDSRDNAKSFSELAKAEGMQKAAETMGLTLKTTAPFSEYATGTIPAVGRSVNAMKWIFAGDRNEVSQSYKVTGSISGNVVFQVAEITPEGARPLEDVENVIKAKLQTRKQVEKAAEYAEGLLPKIKSGSTLKSLAAEDTRGLLSADTTGSFFLNGTVIPGVGRSFEANAALLELPLNQVSGVLKGTRDVFLIKVLERDEFNEDLFASQRSTLRNSVMQSKARTMFTTWYKNLKDQVEIEDYRYKFNLI